MTNIVSFIKDESAFDPNDIRAMSLALEDVCTALKVDGNASARETIAIRIIELARQGVRNQTLLRDRILTEANGGTGC